MRPLPPTTSDAALVASLKAGEPGSAELLFKRYRRLVEVVMVRTVGFDSELPDLIHEVFARALKRIRSLRESWALKTWMGRIAYFTGRGFLRDRQIRRRWLSVFSSDDVPEPAAVVASPEVSRTLGHAYAILRALPSDESTVFSLRVIEGMALAEIAEIAGVSIATVKRRIVRAERFFWQRARRDPMLLEHARDHRRKPRPCPRPRGAAFQVTSPASDHGPDPF